MGFGRGIQTKLFTRGQRPVLSPVEAEKGQSKVIWEGARGQSRVALAEALGLSPGKKYLDAKGPLFFCDMFYTGAMSKEQVLELALRLSPEKRAQVARKLPVSVEDPTPEENERLWPR